MPGYVPQDPSEIDPLVRQLTSRHLDADVAEFERLLNTPADEAQIHAFLAEHSYFFNNAIRLFGISPLYSKIRLGSEYEVDFAYFDPGSVGPVWNLIEIESPKSTLFTKSGDPSSTLNHAMRQVSDWQDWIHENQSYVRHLLPYIDYPFCYIFAGRRSELTPDTARRLRRLNYDNRMSFEVHSLDWFVSSARSVAFFLSRGQGGSWPLPMHAMSHQDLTRGLPPLAHQYVATFARTAYAETYPAELLEEREYKYDGQGGGEGEELV
ncbi:MAG TPA: Shedu anti-phage system protein SduA domain-containing protein [Longimicrobium sp.]|nr:Shedu anti-phage system protein SduA domain-containing protein [Longimicrobium sp.]